MFPERLSELPSRRGHLHSMEPDKLLHELTSLAILRIELYRLKLIAGGDVMSWRCLAVMVSSYEPGYGLASRSLALVMTDEIYSTFRNFKLTLALGAG